MRSCCIQCSLCEEQVEIYVFLTSSLGNDFLSEVVFGNENIIKEDVRFLFFALA